MVYEQDQQIAEAPAAEPAGRQLVIQKPRRMKLGGLYAAHPRPRSWLFDLFDEARDRKARG